MDIEKMMEALKMFQMLNQMANLFGSAGDKKDDKKDDKKKEDMTATERLAALEEMYKEKDEKDELLARIEALEKKAPRINTDAPDPVGIDDIIKGLVPGILKPDKEDK